MVARDLGPTLEPSRRQWRREPTPGGTSAFISSGRLALPFGSPRLGIGILWTRRPVKMADVVRLPARVRISSIGACDAHCGPEDPTRGSIRMPLWVYTRQGRQTQRTGGWHWRYGYCNSELETNNAGKMCDSSSAVGRCRGGVGNREQHAGGFI